MGQHRQLRCGEAVIAILRDASREDPWGALVSGTILKTRRMLMKSDERKAMFFDSITRLIERSHAGSKKRPFPGPTSAFVGAMLDLGVRLEVDKHKQRLVGIPPHGPQLNLYTRRQK